MSDGRVVIDSELNDKGLEKGLSDLQNKLKSAGDGVKDVGKTLSKSLTVPLTAAAGFAVKLGMDFESGMARVAAVSGATAEEMDAMEAQARELGATTKFSALQAAEGMEFLARAGFSANEVMEAMPGLLDLAAASGADLGVAADIASNILSGFGMEAAEAGRVADVLAAATANSNTTVESMGEAMKYVAPVAAALGISVEETAAAVGVLGDAGIAGGQAGTVLRAGLLRLASPTSAVSDLMDELGLEIFDAEGQMKSMPEVIGELEKGLEGMTDQQKTATLETLFGAQAVSGWSALISAGSENLGDFTGSLNDAEGAAAEMAAIMGDTTAGKLLQLRSALEEVALRIWESLQPAIETVIGIVQEAVDWFNSLSDEFIAITVIIGAVAAAIGPLLVILGTLIASVGQIMGSLKLLGAVFGALTGPVGIVIAIIGSLIAIGVLLYQNWETVKEKAIDVFGHFEPLLATVRGAFQTLLDSVGPIMDSLKNLWQSLIPLLELVGAAFMAVFGVITGVFTGVIAAIGPLINAFVNLLDFIVNVVNAVVALFTGDFAGAFQFLQDAGQSAVDFFINIFKGLANFVKGFVQSIIDFFQGLYMTLVGNSIIPDMVNAIVDWFKDLFKRAIDLVKSIVDGVVNFFTNLYQQARNIFNNIRNTISNVFNDIRNTISNVINSIRNTITNVFNAIRNTISNVMNSVRSTISNIWNGIRNTISNVVNSIRNTISNIFNSLRGIVSNAFNSVRNAVSNGIRSALRAVTDRVKDFFNAGRNIVTSIADGIKNAVGKVTGAISDVAGKIRDFLPFSPAKEGPLTDIHKLNFEGPISDSIDSAIPDIQAKLNAMLDVPRIAPGSRITPAPQQNIGQLANLARAIEKLASRPVSVQVEGEEILNAIMDPLDLDLEARMDLEAYMRGER